MFELRSESRTIMHAILNNSVKLTLKKSSYWKKKKTSFVCTCTLLFDTYLYSIADVMRATEILHSLRWMLILHFLSSWEWSSNEMSMAFFCNQIKVPSFEDFGLNCGEKKPNSKSNGVLNNWVQFELILNFLMFKFLFGYGQILKPAS